jgi:hypothetical protein
MRNSVDDRRNDQTRRGYPGGLNFHTHVTQGSRYMAIS